MKVVCIRLSESTEHVTSSHENIWNHHHKVSDKQEEGLFLSEFALFKFLGEIVRTLASLSLPIKWFQSGNLPNDVPSQQTHK